MKKRLWSILLTACLLVGLLPTVALAVSGSVNYLNDQGVETTYTGEYTELTNESPGGTTWTDGWYVVTGDVTIGTEETPQRVTVSGDVRLILTDGCTLTVNGGIQVQDDDDDITNGSANALTIYAQSTDESTMGKLIAKGAEYDDNAAIGGYGDTHISVGGSGGAITINGGNITASSYFGAGIGGGYGDHSGGSGGAITITGGVVKAESSHGAGIGGGEGAGDGGSGGKITINGGSVIATGVNGAGIGGGQGDLYGGSGGEITITGGVVKAESNGGAAIGGGYSGGGTGGDGGKITITGGNTTASGYTGTAIGGGYGTRGGSGGEVTITGGTVTATGNASGNTSVYIIGVEGIGGGRYDITSSTDGTFQTTNNGNAVIFASSIGDQSHKADWSGIIFEGDAAGIIYGESVAPTDDFTIPAGKTLTIGATQTLTIPEGVTMTVNGTLTNNGKIYVDGTFTGTADNLYYPLTITNATGSGDISEYNSKTYGRAGGKITLTPGTPQVGYLFDSWEVSPESVQISNNNSFTMPSTPLEITAQWKDVTAPVISGIEDGEIYCSAQTVTVSDNDGIASVTINGNPVSLDKNGQFTLNPAEGTQKVVAKDKAGNETSVTVTVNNGHTGGTATCTQKAKCGICGEEYGELANHSLSKTDAKEATCTEDGNIEYWTCSVCHKLFSDENGTNETTFEAVTVNATDHPLTKTEASAATVTATGNKEYWHCKDCGKYFADENGTKEIKLEDTIISKLSPEIIEGKGQSITAGEKKELTFKSNAAFSDFIRVELDGKTLDEKNYTVKEGSTIVTLKADYVATLSAGEHTIGIVSESGTASTTFTVNAKTVVDDDTKSPQTGDNSHMALWIALLAASVFGLAGTAVYSKRKRVR